MKKYIKSSFDFTNLPTLESISVKLDLADIDSYIESSDLIGYNKKDLTQVVEDWKSFISLVRVFADTHKELEIFEERYGKPLKYNNVKYDDVYGSYYFYIGVKDPDGDFTGKIIVDFRLSNHESTKTSIAYRETNEKEVLEIIQKTYPNAEVMMPRNLVVNKDTFKDYGAAQRALVGMLFKIIAEYS